MAASLSVIIALESLLLLFIGVLPLTLAASVVAKVAANEVELQPEGLALAVWKAAVKGVAK